MKLDDNDNEFLPPTACSEHSRCGADRACANCNFHKGVVAVKPSTPQRSFTLTGKLRDNTEFTATMKRCQLPVTTAKAATLHSMQGSTANPGLIFHWKFPRRLSQQMKWLAAYVALSRVETLRQFRSIGLTPAIRTLMEQGPPEGLPFQFDRMFGEKIKATQKAAVVAMRCLGWANQD